jgi:serine protease Do
MPENSRIRLLVLSLLTLVLGLAAAGAAVRGSGEDGAGRGLPATGPAAPAVIGEAWTLSEAFVAIAEAVTPSVVRIEVERTVALPEALIPGGLEDLWRHRYGPGGGGPGGRQPELIPERGGGSGFIVSEDGHILTNHHVISGATRIWVTLRDRRTLEATVVGTDPTTDVAVIQIQAGGLPAVALGDSDGARVGEWVMAIGNPGFEDSSTLDFTVTGGIISAKGRPLNLLGQELAGGDPEAAAHAIEDFIQTDAVINPGNSGGPLVDLRGTVIGINTAIASTTGYSQGYGFAVPSNLARRVMADLVRYGHVRRALLGIVIVDAGPEDAEVYGLGRIAGVVVEDFSEGSPAARSGLQRHDVITAVNGATVERVGHLQRLVALQEPGDEVTLDVVRYGSALSLRVRLEQAPTPERRGAVGPARVPAGAGVGIELEELTPELARRLGFSRPGGVIVLNVAPGSAAERRNVVPGARLLTLNRQPVAGLGDARAALQRLVPGEVASLLLEQPDGRTYIANVRIP